jgi:hypothetical protein
MLERNPQSDSLSCLVVAKKDKDVKERDRSDVDLSTSLAKREVACEYITTVLIINFIFMWGRGGGEGN